MRIRTYYTLNSIFCEETTSLPCNKLNAINKNKNEDHGKVQRNAVWPVWRHLGVRFLIKGFAVGGSLETNFLVGSYVGTNFLVGGSANKSCRYGGNVEKDFAVCLDKFALNLLNK